MSEHLEKAKAALAEAKELPEGDPHRHKLLDIAAVQSQVASADALTRIADRLDALAGGDGGINAHLRE